MNIQIYDVYGKATLLTVDYSNCSLLTGEIGGNFYSFLRLSSIN